MKHTRIITKSNVKSMSRVLKLLPADSRVTGCSYLGEGADYVIFTVASETFPDIGEEMPISSSVKDLPDGRIRLILTLEGVTLTFEEP